jgi:nucleolar protein 56
MKATVVECLIGAMAFNEKNELTEKALFPKRAEAAAQLLAKIEAGKLPKEVADLIDTLRKKGYDTFVFENADLAREVERKLSVKTEISNPSKAGELLRSNIEQFAIKTGFTKDSEQFKLWTHQITMEIAKARVRGAIEKRDLIVAQAIQTVDELDKTTNLLMARAREWYGIHFPELDRLLDKHETYSRLIVKLGTRDNFTPKNLRKEGIPDSKADAIAKVAGKSMGADITDEDLTQIQNLCREVTNLYEQRQNLETYLDSTMEEVAPNTKFLVGSLLGARMIALAGGLTSLAKRPASTVQVLGAEKALFRSLKTGSRPPKHGLIFQHTLLHDAKRWQRGKIARALAGKLAIAARADAFGGRNIGERLKEDLQKRVDEIRQKYDQPPTVRPYQPKHERLRRGKRQGKPRRER